MMNTDQINKILKKLKVRGTVYPMDMLPDVIHYPSIMICNTDPHDEPGQHWIAILFDCHKHGEYFDPYGLNPYPPFIPFMNQHSTTWIYNDVCLQSPISETCGEHCLSYLIHRCRGIQMNTYINSLNKDLLKNDIQVYKFIVCS